MKPDEDQDTSKISMCELSLAQLLLLPPDSIQVQALKRELFRYLEEKIEADELTKRSFASLVRDGNLPYVPKRSIEALARSGLLKPIAEDYQDEDIKRSIANLAKNGQLPTFQRPEDEQTQTKRGIESLARNGDLHGKRKLQNLLEDLYGKRNIASLARGFNYPGVGKRYIGALARSGELRYDSADDDYEKRNIASIVRNGKRNVQSLVRTNNLPGGKRYYIFDELKRNIASLARTMGSRYTGKRAVPTAALLRQDGLMKPVDHHHYEDESSKSRRDNEADNENEAMEKRNIASLKSQMKSAKFKRSTNENETSTRSKRQADYWEPSEEYPVPVYQNNNVYDYEELMQSLTGEYPTQEKRFLGKFFQPTSNHILVTYLRNPIQANLIISNMQTALSDHQTD